MLMNLYRYALLIFCIYACPYTTFSQQLFIQKYPVEVYHGSVQNWSVTQDERGIMYFANTDGVLIFDGTHWEIIPLPGEAYCLAVASDKHGKVYVGGRKELGYLEKNTFGNYAYHSLIPSLPENIRNTIDDVWDIAIAGTAIFFSDMKHCVIYDKGTVKILNEEKLWLANVGDNVYAIKNGELTIYKDGEFHKLDILKNTKIHFGANYQTSSYMLLDDKNQVWTVDLNAREKKPKLLSENVNTALKNMPINAISSLSDDRIAVFTNEQIHIISLEGKILYSITSKMLDESNLSSEIFFEDAQHNIWFVTDEFIGTIITSTPLAYYDKHNGYSGSIFTLGEYHGQRYVGTAMGLYRLKDKDTFEFLPNTGTIWGMANVNDKLYIACDKGVIEVVNQNLRFIIRKEGVLILTFCSVNHRDDCLIVGTYDDGIALLSKRNGTWSIQKIKGFDEETRYIQQDDKGNFWISHYGKGIWKLQLNDSLNAITEKKFYTTAKGLPSDLNNRIHKLKDHTIIATTGNGIYTYDDSKDTFEPDSRFDKALHGNIISAISESPKGDIYFRGRTSDKSNELAGMLTKEKNGIYSVLFTPFNKISWVETDPQLIAVDDGVWIGNNNKLIIYNHEQKTYFQEPLQLFIKKVTAADSVISTNMNDAAHKQLTIPYAQNSLRFDFDIIHYEDADKNEFQYKLAGFDETWSDWSTAKEAYFTYLPEGDYTFMVRGRNIYKVESSLKNFSFHITPPIYRTVWAYIIYLELLGLIVYSLIRLRTKSVIKQKEILQKEVNEKTKELLAMNEEIMAQNEEISQINNEVNRKNTEIKNQSEILRESNYTKDKLFSIISHDLRGPIFQFRELFTMMDAGYISADEFQKDLMPNMRERINYVATLTDNLLHWAKDQLEGIQVKPSTFTLQDAVDENIKLVSSQASKKSIELSTCLQRALRVHADKDMIKLVLRNLLSNAVKFTPERGTIEIATRSENGYAYISVVDSGIGISPEEVCKIMEKKYFTTYGTAGEKGSGLGLMLCCEFAEKNGGTLQIESKPGQGSTFTFNIPLVN
ncbi:MAG TPA: ATP-binding protein [Cyclobacteriaceae bacterium]